MEEHAERVVNSLFGKGEKKLLVWLAKKQPKCLQSDHFTYIGLLGAIVCAVGYILSNNNLNYMWLAVFGLFLNWYGDSLDGTLARVRKTPRPIYGFYVDHNIDGMTISIMCIGAGLSPMISLVVAMFVLLGYLLMSIFTYINAHLKGEFRITYGKIGPTEFRMIAAIVSLSYVYLPFAQKVYEICGYTCRLYDIIGSIIAISLFTVYFSYFLIERRKYNKIDPLKPFEGFPKEKK